MPENKEPSILSVKRLSFSYENQKVLHGVSFDLYENETLGIIGESGSGKTSLLKIIAGFLFPEYGEIQYKGASISGSADNLLPGMEKIKLVNQDFDLMPFTSVDENMLRPALNLSLTARKRMLGYFHRNLKLGKVKNQKAANISGGQKQRAAIGTALAAKPEILLLDEPFSNLDYPLKKDIMELLKSEWRAEAMILITHEPADIMEMTDRLIVLQKGRIIQQGLTHEIYNNPRNEYVARLLGAVNVLSPYQAELFGLKSKKEIFIRPHHFVEAKDGVSLIVENSSFLGGSYRHRCRLKDTGIIEVDLKKSHEGEIKVKMENKIHDSTTLV